MLLHTYLVPIFRRFIHDDPLIYLAATLYTLFSLRLQDTIIKELALPRPYLSSIYLKVLKILKGAASP